MRGRAISGTSATKGVEGQRAGCTKNIAQERLRVVRQDRAWPLHFIGRWQSGLAAVENATAYYRLCRPVR
jgi:hypothetical protein